MLNLQRVRVLGAGVALLATHALSARVGPASVLSAGPMSPPARSTPARRALTPQHPHPVPRVLRLSLLGHDIGVERSTIEKSGNLSLLRSHFEYNDRGTTVALDATLTYRDDFTPVNYEAHGKSYRYFPVDASVKDVPADGHTFTLEGMAPIAVQGLLVQYWLGHGKPPAITLLPSGDVVRIRETASEQPLGIRTLRVFELEGVVWGREELLLDAEDMHVAGVSTTAGVLPFGATDEIESDAARRLGVGRLQRRFSAAAAYQQDLQPKVADTFALVGGQILDGTSPALPWDRGRTGRPHRHRWP